MSISFSPTTFVSGGLLDDADVTIRTVRAVVWDYKGEAPESLALRVDITDKDGTEYEQYVSAGNPADYEIVDGGRKLDGKGAVSGLRKNTNAAVFLTSLIEAGFPPDKLAEDLGVLDNMDAHILRKPAPKRPGLDSDRQSRFEPTVLAVSKILRLPWQKAKAAAAPAAGKPAAAAAPTATAGAEEPLTQAERAEAGEILAKIVGEDPNLTKQKANIKIFQLTLSKRPAFRKLLQSPEFQTELLGAPIGG